MRELLIDAIFDLSSDELESLDDVLKLAKESEDQLIRRIIHIANYYRDQYTEATIW
jgi:hypothetical protein